MRRVAISITARSHSYKNHLRVQNRLRKNLDEKNQLGGSGRKWLRRHRTIRTDENNIYRNSSGRFHFVAIKKKKKKQRLCGKSNAKGQLRHN